MKEKNLKKSLTYADAAKRCRLTQTELRMAQAMKISPRGLIHNLPPRSGRKEKWKNVPGLWIRRLYESKDRGLRAARAAAKEENRRLCDAYTRLLKDPCCFLSETELCMARRLALPPSSLISPGHVENDPWIIPPALRVRRLFDGYAAERGALIPRKEPEP